MKRTKKAEEGEMCNFVLVFSLYIPVQCVLTVPFFTEVFNGGRECAIPLLRCRQLQGLEAVMNSTLFGSVCLIPFILRHACVITTPETGFGCV